ncbi:precorrin-4 C(11)-methyltransferase [Acidiferrimicrobium sp. IK]|uniref:precorrin-4 C(11)-methyltransferase n=1 Tax=Acidiferrimicrobium sp. IK TaxID=2871700 RepID=UPI0021CB51E5|nr:precorrin-4 C(11)-methyltransferase [Acidiferrimicrobium sp. IK]MCU4187447.1 precorrin-4 C(11)-methyltransferase [Acidiferrimicrobium sp. IK]
MISFVGAGPGAADLLTLRAAERLAAADVVVWAASLVPEEVLDGCRDDVVLHDSAGMTLEEVTAVFDAHPNAAIVRLHSGDPTIYSAVAEQIDWCRRHHRDYEIVPGVSSVTATAAAVGRELTVPGLAQTVVLTRLAHRTAASVPARESVAEMARRGATMALYLSAARPEALQAELLCDGSAYSPSTPVVIGYRVSWPDQEIVLSTVGTLVEDLAVMGRTMSTLILVGDVLAEAEVPVRSHVYSGGYAHTYRASGGTPR